MVRNSIRPKVMVAAAAMGLAMSGAAWAQVATDTDEPGPATETLPMPGSAPVIAAQEDGQALASEVVGAGAVTPTGEDLGEVEDLILGQDGRVEGVVLSVGGLFGIGDKQVAVPWAALVQRGPDEPLVVEVSAQQLEAAPEFQTAAEREAERQAMLSQPAGAPPASNVGGLRTPQ